MQTLKVTKVCFAVMRICESILLKVVSIGTIGQFVNDINELYCAKT